MYGAMLPPPPRCKSIEPATPSGPSSGGSGGAAHGSTLTDDDIDSFLEPGNLSLSLQYGSMEHLPSAENNDSAAAPAAATPPPPSTSTPPPASLVDAVTQAEGELQAGEREDGAAQADDEPKPTDTADPPANEEPTARVSPAS